MRVFAISDPHLSLGRPDKSMTVFGEVWANHPWPMAERWREVVAPEDIVVVPGDISWAMKLDGALPDLELLAGLPGRKVLVRGNHDYWWQSIGRVRAALADGMYAIQNDAVLVDGVAVAGCRLWDNPEVGLEGLAWREGYWATLERSGGSLMVARAGVSHLEAREPEPPERTEQILTRELERLRASLSKLPGDARLRVAAVHYPPVGPSLKPTRASELLEAARVDHCVFGHLHGVDPARQKPLLGERNGVRYWICSCDMLDFRPIEIARV